MTCNLLVAGCATPILNHCLYTHITIVNVVARHQHVVLHPHVAHTTLRFLLLLPEQQLVLQILEILCETVLECLEQGVGDLFCIVLSYQYVRGLERAILHRDHSILGGSYKGLLGPFVDFVKYPRD